MSPQCRPTKPVQLSVPFPPVSHSLQTPRPGPCTPVGSAFWGLGPPAAPPGALPAPGAQQPWGSAPAFGEPSTITNEALRQRGLPAAPTRDGSPAPPTEAAQLGGGRPGAGADLVWEPGRSDSSGCHLPLLHLPGVQSKPEGSCKRGRLPRPAGPPGPPAHGAESGRPWLVEAEPLSTLPLLLRVLTSYLH